MKFDTEKLLDAVRDFLQADLPAKLDEIDAEKADGITLEDIPNANYYLNEAPVDLNASRFIVYGLQSASPISAGPVVALAFEIFIIIGHTGLKNEIDDTVNRKLLRYTRAAKEVLSANFANLGGFSKLEVAEYPSNPQITLETGETIRVSGLVASATIA